MANYAFCAQIILRVRTGALGSFCEHFFIVLGRSTLCEFNKTKFVQIGQCLTNWQLSKVAQNRQILIILIVFTEMLILGNFGKLPIGQILSDLDKVCFAELTQGISSQSNDTNFAKISERPCADTQNMICAQNAKLAITPSNFIQSI